VRAPRTAAARNCFFIAAALASFAVSVSVARGDALDQLAPMPVPEAPRDPYAGVVTDATITFVGHDFYNEFVSAWRQQAGVEQFSLAIIERPSARWGSLVWIEYRNRQVFRAFLSPGQRDFVRQAGRNAAGIVYKNVVETEVGRLMFGDPDLAPDEF